MENFSTPRDALVPRLTNLLTIAVVFGAVAWSGAHRPVEERREAGLGQSTATEQALPVAHESQSDMHDELTPAIAAPLHSQPPQFAPAPAHSEPKGLTQVKWDQPALPAQSNGFQAVGFVATSRH